LDHRRADASDWTLSTYRYRLDSFVEWCADEGIETVDEIDGWVLEQFFRHRQAEISPVSLKGQMSSLRVWLAYLERIEAVDEGLSEKVDVPTITADQESSDVKLEADDAKLLLRYYRNSRAEFATPRHVVLELLWNTGCRQGGLQALDLRDYDSENQHLAFRHRPETGTRLKNGPDGERVIAIPEAVCEVVDAYIARDRYDKRDQYGREPLLSARQGRPSSTSIRSWAYLATQPCVHTRCPHGKDQKTCEYRERGAGSKCPSSRSPHHIRTGSITWHLDRGIPLEVVAERVNAAPETIKRHYDKASDLQKLEQRRETYTSDFDIEE
jgi:site-specific recombinase XerD